MRSKTNFWKRSMAALLSFVMILGMVPAFSLTADAYTHTLENGTQGDSYISLPITIRDFPADGMLFENNEYDHNAGFTKSGITATREFTGAAGGTMSASAKDGYVRYTSGGIGQYITWTLGKETRTNLRYAAIKFRTNAAYRSQPTIGHRASDGDHYVNFTGTYNSGTTWKTAVIDLGSGSATVNYVTLKTQLASGKYIDIAYIAFCPTKEDAQAYNTNGGSGDSEVYHSGNTVGYGMLLTNGYTHDSILVPGNGQTISGSEYIGYGGYADSPAKMTEKGFTGAYYNLTQENGQTSKQWVHGALIRSNLTEPKLDANKNLIYTKGAVDYMATYMEDTLTEVWKNSDGSYNLWYVMGDKLFNDNNQYVGKGASNATRDLAAVLRSQIIGKGSYDEAKEDFTSGKLATIQDIDSYYDAAYFLLHTTFDDVQGYGLTAPEYKEVRLVKKTNSDGTVYYTFNSAFDKTTYNYQEGYIVNFQTTKVTDRGGDTLESAVYTRGNIQAENRFDPLGPSGAGKELGYGMSGSLYNDYYAELGFAQAVNDKPKYYDTTNYNLSLEGHAQFIYYEDDQLYFTFTGDDDVYLYINGTRVLDVGGAHAIGKVTIKLNDVASLCGLRDGQAYDFDFYYMERHGTAANFGIETNIKIVDPSMTTTKTGYQNGVNTGYNGYIHPLLPVVYEFSLENKGEADIQNLTFTDDNIGVILTPSAITLNSETTINDLSVALYNAGGTIKQTIAAGSLTEAKLMELLTAGLAVGEKIVIYGFNYTVTENDWTAGSDTFPNTVYTTATSIGENNSTKSLNGMADWKVRKSEYTITPFHVYEWMGKGVTLTKDELLKPFIDAGVEGISGAATITVTNATGDTNSVNVNKKAVVASDGSITYNGTVTGADTFYYTVTEGALALTVGVTVYSYDVADNTYVLDYGLSVELNGSDFGFQVNDTLALADNPHATTASVTGVQDATSNYGTFTWDDPSLKYTPTDIIDNTDSVRANVQVLEDGATELTKFTGVAMYETITTAPASVVYYEENHPGITYVNTDENQWAHYETVDEDGNTVAGTEQSADQDSNYGSDPNYEEDKNGEWDGEIIGSTSFNLDTSDLNALQASGIEALNQYLGLSGEASNGTINVLEVKETAEVMYFDFVGTGFEIISRTTDEQYAVINVMVDRIDTVTNDDGSTTNSYTRVSQKPVITESKGGDLYQVPIISITGLEKAEYRVTVKAAGSTLSDGTTTKTRILYIDGIRIYGPLSNDEALLYYNPEEYQADIFEIKELIQTGNIIYADASDTGADLTLVTGTTMIEDVDENGVLTEIEDVEVYMNLGPNNELYLDGNNATGIIAFYLTPIELDENGNEYPDGARTIEIGAHRKSDSFYVDQGDVDLVYGSTADAVIDGTNLYTVSSGTEMYYTIDVNNLELKDGKYLVMIGTNGSEYFGTTLALTNLKIAGYTISLTDTEVQAAVASCEPLSTPLIAEPFAVYRARVAAMEPEVEEVQIPVNENLTIISATLKAAKVVSGKVATVVVKAGTEAQTIVVTDAEGNVVEATKLVRKVNGDVVNFQFIWTVAGNRGDELTYTIRVYDADGLASVNAETVTVTIK